MHPGQRTVSCYLRPLFVGVLDLVSHWQRSSIPSVSTRTGPLDWTSSAQGCCTEQEPGKRRIPGKAPGGLAHSPALAQGLPFNQFDLGQCTKGDVWRVELSRAANVFMVDSSNLSAFKRGRDFKYYGGGLIRRSPHDLVVPRSGRWYIVAHTWGLRGSAKISVTPLQPVGPMPPAAPHQVDLGSIATNAASYPGSEGAPPVAPAAKRYDVFVSHASEDKDSIVRPLAHSLQAEGLKVWYDEFELRIGSSLRRSIDAGLANSRFGVVVLSESFFKKGWSNYELDGLVTREVAQGGTQLILPLWHRVTKEEVIEYSPSLADKLALRTSDSTVEEIAAEIASVIRDA
jgi:hypothetical protein